MLPDKAFTLKQVEKCHQEPQDDHQSEDTGTELKSVQEETAWIYPQRAESESSPPLKSAFSFETQRTTNTNVLKPFPGEPRWPVSIEFSNVQFLGKASSKDLKVSTVGTAICDAIRVCRNSKCNEYSILDNISGKLHSGTSTLLLGAPGSGKSSFLKLLAGRLRPSHGARLIGKVTYNGHVQDTLEMKRVATYVSQVDSHMPLQTVRKIFEFASQTVGSSKAFSGKKGTKPCRSVSAEQVDQDLATSVDTTLELLGLSSASETIIGNELFRGVSGGERKRVTIGEMLFGRHPVLLLDEITTGLDSNTALNIIRKLTQSAREMGSTLVVSLLQPGPELIESFDDIIIMSEGAIIYHGPVEGTVDYFASLGYKWRVGRSLGEFLSDMASLRRCRYYDGDNKEGAFHTTAALGSLWRRKIAQATFGVDEECPKSEQDPIPSFYMNNRNPFILDAWTDFKVVFRHQLEVFWSNRLIHFALLLISVIISVVVGCVFYNLTEVANEAGDLGWMRNRVSVIYFMSFLYAVTSFESLPFIMQERDVVHKQLDAGMMRAISFVLAKLITMIVTIVFEVVTTSLIVLNMTNIVDRNAGDMATTLGLWIGVSTCLSLATNALTLAIAYASPDLVIAFLVHASIISGIIYCFNGIVVSEGTIPGWLVWIFWLSPASHAFRGLAITVFDSNTFAGRSQLVFDAYEIRSDRTWIFYGALYCLGIAFFSTVAQWILLRNVRFDSRSSARTFGPVEEDIEEEKRFLEKEETSCYPEDPEWLENALTDEPEMSNEADERGTDSTRPTRSKVEGLAKSMPCPKLDFSFRNISYTVSSSGLPRQLLHNVNGHVKNGRMCAIIGATGAGKTTLLNQLALRKTSGERTGDLIINGQVVTNAKRYQRLLSFCEQEDHHCAFYTVREAVLFSARLRLPKGTSTAQLEKFVDSILGTLSLEIIRDYKIGVKGHGGLSVGQFKRLTVAVELAANPAILFLDEPTSGLDATAAEITMRAVQKICMTGRTVLCTIHQPSREVFALFDDILLLQKGGYVAFHGPVSEMIPYFLREERNSLLEPIGEYNPSCYALDVLAVGQNKVIDNSTGSKLRPKNLSHSNDSVESHESSEGTVMLDWSEVWRLSPEAARLANLLDVKQHSVQTLEGRVMIPRWKSTFAVLWRWQVAYWRTPEFTLLRVVALTLFMFVFNLVLFQTTEFTTIAETQSYLGVLDYCVVVVSFLVSLSTLDIASKMRSVFYREKNEHIYTTFAYILGASMAEILYLAVTALISVAPVYFVIGLRTDGSAYLAFSAILFATFLNFSFMSQFYVALTPEIRAAVAGVGLTLSFFILFAGLFISREETSDALAWIYTISPSYYSLQALMRSQLWCDCKVDLNLNVATPSCNVKQDCTQVCNMNLPGCTILDIPMGTVGYSKLNVWQFLRTNFDYAETPWEHNILILLAFCLFWKSGEYISLRYLTYAKS